MGIVSNCLYTLLKRQEELDLLSLPIWDDFDDDVFGPDIVTSGDRLNGLEE